MIKEMIKAFEEQVGCKWDIALAKLVGRLLSTFVKGFLFGLGLGFAVIFLGLT